MKRDTQLFPELEPGARLWWYVFVFGDGSMSRDPAQAIAARKAGRFVRLMPPRMEAALWLHRDLEPIAMRE